MSRIICLSLCCLGWLCFCVLPHLQAASMQMPQQVIMDDSQGKVKNPLYTPVTLPHQKHLSQGCPVCHHKWEDRSKSPQKCTDCGCHDLIGASGADMQKVASAYNAYHNRESVHSCMGCHIQKNQEGEAHGPFRNCANCHIKDQ